MLNGCNIYVHSENTTLHWGELCGVLVTSITYKKSFAIIFLTTTQKQIYPPAMYGRDTFFATLK